METASDIIATNEVNIVQIVSQTVTSLCNSLFDSINNSIFPLLDDIVFINEDIISSSNMQNLFGSSLSTGILILANCLLFAFILYYSIRLMISHFTGTTVETPYNFFIKSIFVAILVNSSLFLCSFLINTSYELSSFFCALGEDLFGRELSFITFTNEIKKTLNNTSNIFSLDGIFASTLYISSFSLVMNFSLRYILIKILIILCPFFLLCLMNKPTEIFFKSWLKCFVSLLILQVVVAIILLISFILIKEGQNQLLNNILLIGSINALLKVNQFIKELIGGLSVSSNIQNGLSSIKSIFSK